MPKAERPREKLIKYGPEKLSNSELLAVLLRTGKKGESAVHVAKKILQKFTKEHIIDATHEQLKNLAGIGPAKACEIIACFELGKRLLKEKKQRLYLSPEDIWREMREIRSNKKEQFLVFYLDSRSQELHRDVVSLGTLDKTVVHPREVFEPAVKHMASHIIVAHNHPSGDPYPSDLDIAITKRLIEAGEILGIKVLDHVIVTASDYISLSNEGLMGV